jgi:hypothetical protein
MTPVRELFSNILAGAAGVTGQLRGLGRISGCDWCTSIFSRPTGVSGRRTTSYRKFQGAVRK